VGVILGIIGIIAIANVLNLEEYMAGMMPSWLVLGIIGGATLLIVLAGLYPSMKASKLEVVEALRND